jgi:hypothetical protein
MLLLSLILVSFSGCQDDPIAPTPEPEDTYLVESTFLSSASAGQIQLLAQFSGLGLDVNEFQFDVSVYRVKYKTTYLDQEIVASGLVVLPETPADVGMLSFQHGTIVLDSDAPSRLSASDSELLLYGAIASSGFIGVVPDYVGFGASAEILHPYYVEEYTASAIIDMLFAATELASEENVGFNGRLFLAGYSEGGYATMAAHKALEQDPREMFELVASFAGAGAYDVSGMQSYLFDLVTYDDPYYLAYVASAYLSVYEISGTLNDFFNAPYAGAIPGLFDGMHSGSQINAALTTDMSLLLTPGVREGFEINPEFVDWRQAFQQNSLTDWAPEISLFLYHGTSDTTIPIENSQDTYDALIANGANEDDLTFIAVTGTHSTAVGPYIQDFFPKLLALR